MLTLQQQKEFNKAAQPLMRFLQSLDNVDSVAIVNVIEATLYEPTTRCFECSNDKFGELSKLDKL